MEITQILGYVGAVFIGLVLGLIGGGGSILTVPVLVYLIGINPVIATAYSLFVVGASSLVGSVRNIQKKNVKFKTAFTFAIPAVISVFSTRKFIVPAIPERIFTIGNFVMTKEIGIMLFFAIIMLLASFSMIFDSKKSLKQEKSEVSAAEKNSLALPLLGILTGLITGLVGAGGGFIIIPILVILAGLSMKKAVGTSLLIIAINSLLGFLGDVTHTEIDWLFLLIFTFLAMLGIILGVYLNKFFDGKKLKKAFGWFVLVMGIYIMYKEITTQ